MPYAYYNRLTQRQKKIYRASEQIESVPLTETEAVENIATQLAAALKDEDHKETKRLSTELVTEICACLKIPAASVRVKNKRPSNSREELHGEYERDGSLKTGQITVWMRTASRNQVVAFRTYLRTLLHELCHHLDYELLALEDTFHTEGFFKRESSLFKQIVHDKS